MAISFGALGTIVGFNATPTAVAYPAGVAAGQLLVLVGLSKVGSTAQSVQPTLSGWASEGYVRHGTTASANDTGSMAAMVWTKVADGTESGTISVAWGLTPFAGQAFMFSLSNATFGWATGVATAVRTLTTTAWSVTYGTDPGITTGDFVCVFNTVPTDLSTASSAGTLTATGLTAGSATARIAHNADNTGTDSAGWFDSYQPSAGTSSAVATYASTLTGGTNLFGVSLLLRVREIAGTDYTDGETDLRGLTDAASASTSFSLDVTDSAGKTDAATTVVDYVLSPTDSAGATDDIDTLLIDGTRYVDVELWEDGGFIRALGTGTVTGGVLEFTWDAAELADVSGTGVEIRLSGVTAVEIEAVDWLAAMTATVAPQNRTLTLNDNRGLTDAASSVTEYARTHGDSAGLVDAASPALAIVSTQTDALGSTDTATSATSYSRTLADATGLTDEATTSGALAASDPTGLVDTTSFAATYARTNSDGTGLVDTTTTVTAYSITATDAAGLVDTASAVQVFVATQADATGLADTATSVAVYASTATDPTGLLDAAITAVAYSLTVSDETGTSDTAASVTAFAYTTTDDTGLLDETSSVVSYLRSLTDPTGLLDAVVLPAHARQDYPGFATVTGFYKGTATLGSALVGTAIGLSIVGTATLDEGLVGTAVGVSSISTAVLADTPVGTATVQDALVGTATYI